MNFKRLSDLDVRGKRVFIRADLNVPQDDAGAITDDTRIRASVPGIRDALARGAAVMVTSHLGRPKEGEWSAADSLAPVAARLSELLGLPVPLVKDWVDGGAWHAALAPGQVVLLENCRFNPGEKKDDEALARKMAKLCDVYCNDAFGTAHRAEATTHGIARYAPVACAGPLLAAELDALGKALAHPARPLVAIVGGSKVSTKLTVLKALAAKVDALIVGGGIANTFILAAHGHVGKSLAEADLVGEAQAILDAFPGKVPVPVDAVCAKEFSATATAGVEGDRERRARRHDPRHRPGDGGGAEDDHRPGGHHRLERPGRRVRVRRLRRRHPGAGRRDRGVERVLDRRRRRHRRRDQQVRHRRADLATSRPPAAPSSNSSRARRCPPWRCSNRARPTDRRAA